MKVFKLLIISFFLLSSFFVVSRIYAAENASVYSPKTDYFKAKIIKVSDSKNTQNLSIQILQGSEKGKVIKLSYNPQGIRLLKLKSGQEIVLAQQKDPTGKVIYAVNDKYRIPNVAFAVLLFVALVVIIAGRKGVGALIGLTISLGVIFIYIVPSILSGSDPLATCMIGSIVILLSTTYIAHGFSTQTTIALVSTLSALIITWILATLVLNFTHLSGFGTEEAYELHMGLKSLVDFRGLLLGGIIIATLGALNDVTTTQSAAIFEIYKSNPKQDFDQLLVKGMGIGREHVASLVNTLVLAFVGTSLALFLVYFFNPSHEPLWAILNSEIISEEIIKTIVGTSGLLLSMPIVTILATAVCIHVIGEREK